MRSIRKLQLIFNSSKADSWLPPLRITPQLNLRARGQNTQNGSSTQPTATQDKVQDASSNPLLRYDLKYFRFVTNTQAAPPRVTWSCHQDDTSVLTAILMSCCQHCNPKCRSPDADAYDIVRKGKALKWSTLIPPRKEKKPNSPQTESWTLKGPPVCHGALWHPKGLL